MKKTSLNRIALLALTLCATGAVIVGCASRPGSIVAASVPYQKYEGRTCEVLATDLVHANKELDSYSNKQTARVVADTASVAVTLIPLSMFAGDNAGDVAQWKGEVQAIITQQTRQGCPATAAAPADAPVAPPAAS